MTTYIYNGIQLTQTDNSEHKYGNYVFKVRLIDITDFNSEIEHLKLAIENKPDNCAWECDQLGTIYHMDGNHLNIPEAIKYLTMAAEKGEYASYTQLGHIYENETGYIDIPKAIKYYKLAFQHNSVDSCAWLGQIYGRDSECKNVLKSVKYLGLAIEHNNGYTSDLKHVLASGKNREELAKQCVEHDKKYKNAKARVKELEEYVEELEEHVTELEFQPGGVGCMKAKEEFDTLKEQLH